MRPVKLIALATLLFGSPAFTHMAFGLSSQTVAPSVRFGSLEWNWNPWILSNLALATFGYVRGLRRMNRIARSKIFGGLRYAAFAAGIGILLVALISPFDALDDQLFSAHMLQHLVLLLLAPPLLVFGRPALACLWAFPLSARRTMGHIWIRSGLQRAVHALMSPLLVWFLCSAVLWFWHLPRPYSWALGNESVHAFEHVCFFVSSLMFWSLVLEPLARRRMDYGSTLLFVATFGAQNGLLGALLTFAGRPLYAAHLSTTVAWGLTPLEDQQLAGLIMWIPASLIHLTTLGVLFVVWMHVAERSALSGRAIERNSMSASAVVS
jgi:cytochrome c oxidase assembly factor CtaG